jgi:phenylalanyl-tRNA synthetase beta subunit
MEFKDDLLKEVFIFDYFLNEKKSEIKIGFRFIFQSNKSTITEKEVNDIMSIIIDHTQTIEGIAIPGME